MIRPFAAVFFALACLSSPSYGKEPHRLFMSDDVLSIQISAPFRDLIRNAPNSTAPYAATLNLSAVEPEEHQITLSARGNSRRDKKVCDFPPLRVRFDNKPEDASLFDGQKSLKLVTHCQPSKRYQQYYLLEYTAYKLFNVITPESLLVRIAEIDYVESDTGEVITTRYGFFIEDVDDAAKRNEMKEIDTPDIELTQLNASSAATYSIFQYMIGNLDWSLHNGPEGEDCCHNTKLIGADKAATTNLAPVPYDFDYSGLVDAPYAVAPDSIGVRSVRTRRYRGFCIHNAAAQNAVTAFLAHQNDLLDIPNKTPGLEPKKASSSKDYLNSFFDTLSDSKKLQSRLFNKCRN